MKLNKIMIYLFFVIDVLTLLFSIYLKIYTNYDDTTQFWTNILLNIFAGSLVSTLTAIVNYLICRRRLLKDIMLQCQHFSYMFRKLKYYKIIEEDKNVIKKLSKKNREQHAKDIENDNMLNITDIISGYISIADENMNYFWSLYDDLGFVFDFKDKKKKKYWKDIFNYTYDLVKKIRLCSVYFKIFLDNKTKNNFHLAYSKIEEIQSIIFTNKEINYNDLSNMEFINNLYVSFEVRDRHDDKGILIYNSVSEYLLSKFDEIGKQAFFDKKYNNRNLS